MRVRDRPGRGQHAPICVRMRRRVDGRRWDSLGARVMMVSTSRVCELSTYNFNSRPQARRNTLQNLIGGAALIWVAGACSWTVVSNFNGPAAPGAPIASTIAVARSANALVAAAHDEFAAARTALTAAAQQKFAAAARHQSTTAKGNFLSSYVALVDAAVLDVRGPLASLGG